MQTNSLFSLVAMVLGLVVLMSVGNVIYNSITSALPADANSFFNVSLLAPVADLIPTVALIVVASAALVVLFSAFSSLGR